MKEFSKVLFVHLILISTFLVCELIQIDISSPLDGTQGIIPSGYRPQEWQYQVFIPQASWNNHLVIGLKNGDNTSVYTATILYGDKQKQSSYPIFLQTSATLKNIEEGVDYYLTPSFSAAPFFSVEGLNSLVSPSVGKTNSTTTIPFWPRDKATGSIKKGENGVILSVFFPQWQTYQSFSNNSFWAGWVYYTENLKPLPSNRRFW